MTDPILAEYYQQRAGEYDEVYLKPERQRDIAALKSLLPPLVAGRHVLEIAAGTGYWTQVIAPVAASVTATDLNPEPLRVAAGRDYGRAAPLLTQADAYRLADVPGEFDLVFCGFWWSHIPRADVERFLTGLGERVQPGTTLVILDNRYVPGSNHPISRTGPDGDTYQLRRLRDGREYEVLKNFPSRDQLAADLAGQAAGLRYTELEHYWLACCELTGPQPT
ncbi:MAG TPA: methyltransferase domain-containing protein [Streptosporangiaceae bacterium]|nr:methyltransferase domain-containing protein [Streptosporangiaceae bacterium]